MLATIQSGAVLGIEAYPVDVEVDLGRGMMVFSTVGLPSSAVSEAKTRVKSALINSECRMIEVEDLPFVPVTPITFIFREGWS